MITYDQLNQNDVVFTSDDIARTLVDLFNPKGKILEPCSGEGVFLKYLPLETEWCKITKGKDFFDYKEKVDWIFTNPPYSNFDRFLDHSFELAENVMFLVPIAKVWKSWGTILKIKKYGGIKQMWLVPASRCGFPFGFPVAAIHFQKDYHGALTILYAPENLESRTILL